MPKQVTTEDFIKRAIKIHGEYFNYSYVLYTNMHAKVKIIDPNYGEFWQSPMGHLQGQGHPAAGYLKAANKRKTPLVEFITQANLLHGNLYDYSKVDYKHCDEKVCIIDPEYGEFWQSPYQHLRSHGCPARTKDKKWLVHIDHIIPLSLIHSSRKMHTEWDKLRPLYLFLNSEVNLRKVDAKFNRDKNDHVTINSKTVSASSVRNNYQVISYLISTLLCVDPSGIIAADKLYISSYLGFTHDE